MRLLSYSNLHPSHKPCVTLILSLIWLLFHVCPQSHMIMVHLTSWQPSSLPLLSSSPHGHYLRPLLDPPQVPPSSPAQSQAPAFHDIRDYWGAFFIAHWSIQCPDCNLVLGYRTQHLNTQHTRPTNTKENCFSLVWELPT